MASISSPPPHNLAFSSTLKLTPVRAPFYPHLPSRFHHSLLCRCAGGGSSSDNPSSSHPRWDSAIQDVLRNAIKRFDSFITSYWKGEKDGRNGSVLGKQNKEESEKDEEEEEEWDWDSWKNHFEQIDEQERSISVLKLQLSDAVHREDYEEAARLKVAIAAAATNDTVGRVMRHLNKAVKEERYHDAAILCNQAGAGLVGWWTGVPEDFRDPYGLIIRITAEHGRYVARSYSPRQLATSAVGTPLFEIFVTMNKKGEYRKQAVYLKWRSIIQNSVMSTKASDGSSFLNPTGMVEDKNDMFLKSTEDEEGRDDADDVSDLGEGLSGFQNILRDIIPGLRVKVLKVTLSGKVDRDFISKVIEQIIDEEDEEKDTEGEEPDIEEDLEVEAEINGESDQEKYEIERDTDKFLKDEEQKEMAVKVVIGDIAKKLSSSFPVREALRLPAKLETKGHSSFSLHIEEDGNVKDTNNMQVPTADRKAKLRSQHNTNSIMLELARSIGKEKVSAKVGSVASLILKNVGEFLNASLSQAQSRQLLSGSTTFHRIDETSSRDPLNGLYIGSHGLYTSEIIHMKRKFGQWKDDDKTVEPSEIEFYEYVEAIKLTGDPYVPAGKVAFRAKVGERYQLPHKGIIPEEFGVIARYKGQGRLAEPGFRNPQWVDGELVILDGKFIKGGPVVGFVYWAPEYHFLVFFNRLRLQA